MLTCPLALQHPIVQAPMAGVSTPALAAQVCEAGALGSLGLGAMDANAAARDIATLRSRTQRPFNVNLFVHRPPRADAPLETRWLDALGPQFTRFGTSPPTGLETIYTSFAQDDAMLAMLLDTRPAVVSFHFGLPDAARITALRDAECLLFASVTNLREAQAARAAGIDVLVAQGWEAGGHRGIFDPDAADPALETATLVRLLVREQSLPVIAAGGICTGSDIKAALDLGAVAAQLGTAFIPCPESGANAAYRQALHGPGAHKTHMTRAISGRPARCLGNAFTDWDREHDGMAVPDYPRTYAAGKALAAAARARGEFGFDAQWAGTGASRTRALPAAHLVALLAREMEAAAHDGVFGM